MTERHQDYAYPLLAFLRGVVHGAMQEMLLVFVLTLASDCAFYQIWVRFQREGLNYVLMSTLQFDTHFS